jgi:hypothetical protein
MSRGQFSICSQQSLLQRLLKEIIYFEYPTLGYAIKSIPGKSEFYIKLKGGKQFKIKHSDIQMLPSTKGVKEITRFQYRYY